jgi:hypothetical protein
VSYSMTEHISTISRPQKINTSKHCTGALMPAVLMRLLQPTLTPVACVQHRLLSCLLLCVDDTFANCLEIWQ